MIMQLYYIINDNYKIIALAALVCIASYLGHIASALNGIRDLLAGSPKGSVYNMLKNYFDKSNDKSGTAPKN